VATLGGHQNMRLRNTGDDENLSDVAGPVGSLVADDLQALRAFAVPPGASRDPDVAARLHFAALRRLGCGADYVGAALADSERDLARSARIGARVGLLDRRSIWLAPDMLDQLGVHRSLLNHAAVIVARFDRKRRPAARFIDILIGLDVDHKAATSGKNGRGAGDLPIAGVSDARLDAIAHVPPLLFHPGGNRDREF